MAERPLHETQAFFAARAATVFDRQRFGGQSFISCRYRNVVRSMPAS
jgi:hypothetical protein